MAVTSKIASAQQPLPLGWNYSYLNDGFTGPNGEFISRDMVQIHGSFHKAFAHMYGATGAAGVPTGGIGANGPAGPQGNITWGQNSISPIPSGSFVTSSASSIQPASTLSFETDYGRITLNIRTGDLTLPQGISRDEGIRKFWFGFQKYFKTTDIMVLETKVKDLQLELAQVKASATLIQKDDKKAANKRIVDRFKKKYGNEKLIMVKPDDLAKFLEEA